MVIFVYSERRYLSGESEEPEQMSFIINSSSKIKIFLLRKHETFSSLAAVIIMDFLNFDTFFFTVSVMFHIALLFCSLLGVFSSFGLFIGILIDCKELLLPWILTMIVDCFAEISHFVYIAVFVEVTYMFLNFTSFYINVKIVDIFVIRIISQSSH
jgi:hypothetical protein